MPSVGLERGTWSPEKTQHLFPRGSPTQRRAPHRSRRDSPQPERGHEAKGCKYVKIRFLSCEPPGALPPVPRLGRWQQHEGGLRGRAYSLSGTLLFIGSRGHDGRGLRGQAGGEGCRQAWAGLQGTGIHSAWGTATAVEPGLQARRTRGPPATAHRPARRCAALLCLPGGRTGSFSGLGAPGLLFSRLHRPRVSPGDMSPRAGLDSPGVLTPFCAQVSLAAWCAQVQSRGLSVRALGRRRREVPL